MAVTVIDIIAGPFTANGLEQELPYSFTIFTPEECEVVVGVDRIPLTLDTDYTVDSNRAADGQVLEGGTVTLLAGAVDSGDVVRVIAKPAKTQEQVYTNAGTRISNLNEGLDRAAQRALRSEYDGISAEVRADLLDTAAEAAEGVAITAGGAAGAAAAVAATTFAIDFDDTSERSVAERFDELPVSVADWEGLVTGGDWTAAINAALATGRAVYFPAMEGGYKVTDKLAMLSVGNSITGDGVQDSYILIEDDFNMAATGVLEINTSGEDMGSALDMIGFVFTQPATSVRASFVQYPPAIQMDSCPRVRMGHVRITGAWDGIDARGNTGGFTYALLEIGALNIGVQAGGLDGKDGALDFWGGDVIAFWPWGLLTGGRITAYLDGNTVGMRIGRVDGLDLQSVRSFGPRFIFLEGIGGSCFGNIGSLQLDGDHARVDFGAGRMTIANFYKSTTIANDYGIHQTGGHLALGPGWIGGSPSGSTVATMECSDGFMSVVGGTDVGGAPGIPMWRATGTGILSVTGRQIIYGSNTARTIGFAHQDGATAVLKFDHNSIVQIGSGSGEYATFESDNGGSAVGNSTGGWALGLPPLGGLERDGLYGPNNGPATLYMAAVDDLPIRGDIDDYVLTGGGTIANILPTTEGHMFTIGHEATVNYVNNVNLMLQDARNTTLTTGDRITFQQKDGRCEEVARSVNAFDRDTPRTIASAASITLETSDRNIHITGTTNFGAMTGTYEGHKIDVTFGGVLTIIANGVANIRLNGDATVNTTATMVLGLIYRNGLWQQRYRANNA